MTLHLGVRVEETGSDLRMATILLNEMLAKAQTSVQSMAGHVNTIIAERRVIRQSVKSLRPREAASTKDGGQQGSRPAASRSSSPSPDVVDKLSEIHASVEQLTASSSSMLQVDHMQTIAAAFNNDNC